MEQHPAVCNLFDTLIWMYSEKKKKGDTGGVVDFTWDFRYLPGTLSIMMYISICLFLHILKTLIYIYILHIFYLPELKAWITESH